MESKKFLRDVSASGIQVVVTQVANLIIFYLISKYISKEEFGFYNWSVALCSTIITVMSLGMDLVYVKRVASDIKTETTISLHLFHTLLSTAILIASGTVILTIFPDLLEFHILFLLVLINQSIFSITNSIKLCLNGYEKYNQLAKLSIIISITKVGSIISLFLFKKFTIEFIILAFIANYIIEFVISYYLTNSVLNYFIRPRLYFREYKLLIIESFPQLGTVLFDSALARLDWILMGIIATSVKTAEYTFAFKIFEISKMPYLVIAPILLTRFSKLFKNNKILNENEKINLDNLFKVEIFVAVLIPIIAIAVWPDLFDLITDGKYGTTTALTYIILALCIPMHYSTNFLWTMAFTQGQLKMIFVVTIITSSLNILLNLSLIPFFNSEGAAISFLISTIIQVILYHQYTHQHNYTFKVSFLIIGIIFGIISICMIYWLPIHWALKGIVVLIIYLLLTIISKFISLKTFKSAFI